jgi:hypothetical protein
VASTTKANSVYTIDDVVEFSGAFAVYSEMDGEPQYAYLHEGTYLETQESGPLLDGEYSCYEGEIVDFTREISHENELIVEFTDGPIEEPSSIDGEWIFVETDNERNGAYEIKGISADGDRTVLDIGQKTTVRGLADSDEPDSEYKYIIDSGNSCRIPISHDWRHGIDE